MHTIDEENNKAIREPFEVYIEIQATINGTLTTYSYTNKDIISCELNLRSDLSPIDPTLPESEIVVRIYSPEDVSDIVKNIADDTPLLYWSGYLGDYCPVRKFYISEPVVWADKVLTVKAVDAVHFLDVEMVGSVGFPARAETINTSTGIRSTGSWASINNGSNPLVALYAVTAYLVNPLVSDLSIEKYYSQYIETSDSLPQSSFVKQATVREVLANFVNLFRFNLRSSAWGDMSYYLNYVDAGIPTLTYRKPSSKWSILEADCGDIQTHTGREIKTIITKKTAVNLMEYGDDGVIGNQYTHKPYRCMQVGNAELVQDAGASIRLDTPTTIAAIKVENNGTYSTTWGYVNTSSNIATRSKTVEIEVPNASTTTPTRVIYGGLIYYDVESFMGWTASNNYTIRQIWNSAKSGGFIEENTATATFPIYGNGISFLEQPKTYTKSGYGETKTPSKTQWVGEIQAKDADGVKTLLPDMGFTQLLNRSTKTGSFTWKGDPRMQPRDVFTFVHRDGTEELRTIESINIKHEGGGTIATITYREGIV